MTMQICIGATSEVGDQASCHQAALLGSHRWRRAPTLAAAAPASIQLRDARSIDQAHLVEADAQTLVTQVPNDLWVREAAKEAAKEKA